MCTCVLPLFEALGLKTPSPETLDALCLGLSDWDAEVRFDAALALVRAAVTARGKLMEPLIEVLGGALKDNNRYVAAHAADALDRIGSKAFIGDSTATLARCALVPTDR